MRCIGFGRKSFEMFRGTVTLTWPDGSSFTLPLFEAARFRLFTKLQDDGFEIADGAPAEQDTKA